MEGDGKGRKGRGWKEKGRINLFGKGFKGGKGKGRRREGKREERKGRREEREGNGRRREGKVAVGYKNMQEYIGEMAKFLPDTEFEALTNLLNLKLLRFKKQCKKSAPIGACESETYRLFGNYVKQANQPTDMRVHRKVTLSIMQVVSKLILTIALLR